MSTEKLVRIKPGSPRETHVFRGYHFKKEDGWYRVPTHIADLCAEEPLHEGNPDASPRIFDVKDADAAQKIAAAEKKKVEPAGTPDKPKAIRSADPAAAAEEEAPESEEVEDEAPESGAAGKPAAKKTKKAKPAR